MGFIEYLDEMEAKENARKLTDYLDEKLIGTIECFVSILDKIYFFIVPKKFRVNKGGAKK